MNKKLILPILIIVIIVAIIVCVVAFKPANKTLDLQALSTQISSEGTFAEMSTMPLDKETAVSLFGLEEAQVEEVVGAFPMMNVHASMYVIIKATDGNVDTVLGKVTEYGNAYAQQWERYLPEQYDLVTQRKIGKVGNYVYMIVASTAADIEALIK